MDESVIDKENSTATYVTTHFSTYLLVDRNIWLDAWRRQAVYPEQIKTYYDVAFVLDVSGSMSGSSIAKAKTAMNAFVNSLTGDDKSALITFNSYADVKASLTSDKEAISNAVSTVTASGGTNANAGLSAGINELINNKSNSAQIVIMICDGDVNCTDSTINLAVENGIQVYTVNVINASNSKLENIAAKTGGEYYYAATSDEIGNIFDMIQSSTIVSDDKDHDGLKDIWETEGMQISNGTIIKTDPHNADTDGDGLNDGEEMGMYDEEYDYFPNYHSNPNDPDTDDDGCNDFYDAMPKTKARNSDKFLVVNSTKYYPEFVNKTSSKEKSDACYGMGTYNTNELIDIQCRAASFVVYLYGGILYNEDNTPLIVPDAAANLDHFLQNTGTDFEINVESLLSSSSYAEGLYKSYKDNMAEYVEDILKKGDTLIIGTRNDVNDGNGFVAFSKNIQRMFFDINWSTGFGECNSCILGYYTHTYDNDYIGKCIYTVFDFYDWEENGAPIGPEFIIPSDGELYKLHHAGWAKHYYMSGSYTTEHNWVVN